MMNSRVSSQELSVEGRVFRLGREKFFGEDFELENRKHEYFLKLKQ